MGFLVYELLKRENLQKLVDRKLIDLKQLEKLAQSKTISWESLEEIRRLMEEKKAVEI